MRGVLIALAIVFFIFPIVWILMMSFQTNEQVLRIPPSLAFEPTLENYRALITGRLETHAGTLDVRFMQNLWNSLILSVCSVALALVLGVPAAYAFARFRFRLGEDIAFTLLSFRFAPPLLVLLPLTLYFQDLGLSDTYVGLVWVYQLICLPLILWIVRGYFEDVSPDIEHAYRTAGHGWLTTFWRISLPLTAPGIAAAGLLAFIFAWNNFIFALVLASADTAAGHRGRTRLRDRLGDPVRADRGRDRALDHPDARARALRPALSRRRAVARRGEGIGAGGMATIELSGVSKRFQNSTALDGVSLGVASGETVAIIGASGAGKTVLLRLIAGLEDPSAGTIAIDGADMASVAPERRGIGMAFQNFALFPHMTAFDNIASPLAARAVPADEVRRGVQSVARMLKIERVLDHFPRALSNGQKQRTALARALAASPAILLLDDPLRNVDAKLRFEMRLEFERLLAEQGATTLYVTQDYREAMALGDRIAVMDQGRFIQVGTPEEIYFEPASIEVARQFGDPTINLVPASPASDEHGAFATIGGARFDLVHGTDAAANGHECVIGMRPEALAFTADAAGAFVVEAVTPLNEKIVTLVAGADGTELLVSRPSHEPAQRPGERVGLRARARDALLFAREDGARLGTGTASAES